VKTKFYRQDAKDAKGRLNAQDDTLDAFFEHRHVEVDEQGERASGDLHVRNRDSLMNGRELLDRLEVDDQSAGDQQIQTEFTHDFTFILDLHKRLPNKGNASEAQLDAERVLIEILGQSR